MAVVLVEVQWPRGWRAMAVGACTAVVLSVAGCTTSGSSSAGTLNGGRSGGESPASSKPTSSSSKSAAELARTEAVAAYLGMWRSMAEAGETSDWRSPDLAKYSTGEALAAITRGLYADHKNGLISKGAPKNHPEVTSVDPVRNPTTVMISDCGDSTDWLQYRKSDGKLADDEPGGRRAITAEVQKQSDGSWKVTGFAVRGLGSC